jgi:hypothetical protein
MGWGCSSDRKTGDAHIIFVRKFIRKQPLGNPNRGLEYKVELRKICLENVNCIEPAQRHAQWRTMNSIVD